MPKKRMTPQGSSSSQIPPGFKDFIQSNGLQFLSQWLKDLAGNLQTGKLSGNETITLPLKGQLRDLAPFLLANGDTTVLNKLLQDNPSLANHPIVWHFIFYISHYIRNAQVDEWRIEEAQTILLRLLESWIQSSVPGARIKPPPKRKGRKLSPQEEQRHEFIYDEYCELLRILKRFKIGLEGQSPEIRHSRLKKAILMVYDRWMKPRAPKLPNTPHINTGPWPLLPDPYDPPSSEVINTWLQVDLGMSAFRDYLAHCLLAHQYNKTRDSIRGIVERQRQKTPPIKPPTIQS